MSKFYILMHCKNGAYVSGNHILYNSFKDAEKGVAKICRSNPSNKFAIVEVKGTYWLDPEPAVLNDLPKADE